MNTIRIISRSSRLAIVQVQEVMTLIQGQQFQLIQTSSYGDKHHEISLMDNSVADIFTRELDEALLCDEADIAIHSAKDLPYPLPQGLEVIALTQGMTSKDALVSKGKLKLADLPKGAKVGTSSLQRKEQILALRPDINIVSIRGNIDQRIAKTNSGEIDALIVAECALKRLGYEHLIAEILPFETNPLQGKLAVVAKHGNSQLKSQFYQLDVRKNYGNVILAGFGPGNPELVTVKTLKAIRQADVIYYDDLIDKGIIGITNAKWVFVGKRKGNHEMAQDEINKLLYLSAIEGKNVLRLKGGDPFVFGRGGEEYRFLTERLVEVSIIPGITAALSAAASMAIPLTLRGQADTVAFCLGYPEEKIKVPNTDTIVYYMGASNICKIAEKAIEAGKDPDMSMAVVHNAGSNEESVRFFTLQEVIDQKPEAESPSIIILGNHVRQNASLLRDKAVNVLITGTNTKYFEKLGKVVHSPMVQIEPEYSEAKALFESRNTGGFDWIIFTSRHAVQHFITVLLENKKDLRWLANSQIVSIGQATTDELLRYGLRPDLTPIEETSDSLIDLFFERKPLGKEVLIPRSNLSAKTLPSMLQKLGYNVTTLTVYNNQSPDYSETINLKDIDIITFASPSAVKNFKAKYKEIPPHISLVHKGDVTKKSLYEAGFLQHESDWVI